LRLILNPEIDVLWRDKSTLQVRNPDGTSNTISDLPAEMKLILSSCTGIVNISEILLNLNIDERIHEDINIALRFLIEHRVLINQSHLYEQSERLHKSYVQIIGINTFAFQIGQLLAGAGVGRIVFDSLTKKQTTVTLGDINILGPRAREIGTSLGQSLRESLLVMGTRAEKPNKDCLPDLVIICEDTESFEINELMINRVPHVFIGKTGEQVNVGPFVIPGIQTCQNCLQLNSLKKNLFIFPLEKRKKKAREIDKNPTLTTLASSLLVTNCVSFLSGELTNSGPSLLNVVCDLDANGPTIVFRKLQPNPQCGCRWEAA
jgi:hypothetical protein